MLFSDFKKRSTFPTTRFVYEVGGRNDAESVVGGVEDNERNPDPETMLALGDLKQMVEAQNVKPEVKNKPQWVSVVEPSPESILSSGFREIDDQGSEVGFDDQENESWIRLQSDERSPEEIISSIESRLGPVDPDDDEIVETTVLLMSELGTVSFKKDTNDAFFGDSVFIAKGRGFAKRFSRRWFGDDFSENFDSSEIAKKRVFFTKILSRVSPEKQEEVISILFAENPAAARSIFTNNLKDGYMQFNFLGSRAVEEKATLLNIAKFSGGEEYVEMGGVIAKRGIYNGEVGYIQLSGNNVGKPLQIVEGTTFRFLNKAKVDQIGLSSEALLVSNQVEAFGSRQEMTASTSYGETFKTIIEKRAEEKAQREKEAALREKNEIIIAECNLSPEEKLLAQDVINILPAAFSIEVDDQGNVTGSIGASPQKFEINLSQNTMQPRGTEGTPLEKYLTIDINKNNIALIQITSALADLRVGFPKEINTKNNIVSMDPSKFPRLFYQLYNGRTLQANEVQAWVNSIKGVGFHEFFKTVPGILTEDGRINLASNTKEKRAALDKALGLA